ncbi:MAG: hypothetical protein LAO05_12135 [Acidobacteriia bacterium]|nr:hypothetical protein [Terriglobia bacterium]
MNAFTSNKIVAAASALLLAAGTALANFAGTDVFIPSLGHGSGSASSQWYACIWVHNPNAAPVNVTFRLLLRDQANLSAQAYNETIPAGDTRRYDDALATLFGVTTKTFGAVRVTTPAGQPVIVNARSYNKPPGFDDMDTTGQFYAAIPASFAIGAQQKTQLLGVYQTTPQNTSEFRYNYGFVETTGKSVTVQVTALDETGAQVGSPKSYTLGGYQASQYNITDLLPSVNTTNVRLEVAVTSGPGQVVVFGSGTSNRANDPSTFEMSFRDELLAENSPASGLTSVAHDGTLTGNGTTATPLGIASGGVGTTQLGGGAVSKGKLSAAGGTDGQVLGTDGSALTWQNDGLKLPYTGAARTLGTAFTVNNTANGYGIYGTTTSTENAGVGGVNNSGTGVYGYGGVGVEGRSEVSNGYGVFGFCLTTSPYAGYFGGKVRVVGNFSVTGTKSFVIDHPLDPENKELWHAAVESSEVLDMYSGNTVTDGEGKAVVQLPGWFQALNTDFRYQLTCIGAFAQAIVEREIEDNRFSIRTSRPNVKVSWQVTARRNDAMMQAHPFVAERDKPEAERGSYLSPLEHGQPREKGVEWALHPEMMREIEAERQGGTTP